MKYIITESKLNEYILSIIEEMFPVDDINYTEAYDDDGNPDDTAYVFYLGDYENDEVIFRWYSKDYWNGPDENTVDYRIRQSPLLVFEDYNTFYEINSMFPNLWKPVFIKWFYESFSLPIKTIL
jgi:hypothetical protein